MIKLMVLNSNIDDLIIAYFVIGVGVFIVLHWFLKALKSPKPNSTIKPWSSSEVLELTNYTLNFNTETKRVKTASLLTKITLFSVSAIVVVMPFYEFVEALRPQAYIAPFTCFPGLLN